MNQAYQDMLNYKHWRTRKMGQFWKAVAMMGSASPITTKQIDAMFSEEMWRKETQ